MKKQIIVAYTEYTREYEAISIESFVNEEDTAMFLLDDLGFAEHFLNEDDEVEIEEDFTLEKLCNIIDEVFVGDGSDSVTAISVKVDGEYLLQL